MGLEVGDIVPIFKEPWIMLYKLKGIVREVRISSDKYVGSLYDGICTSYLCSRNQGIQIKNCSEGI